MQVDLPIVDCCIPKDAEVQIVSFPPLGFVPMVSITVPAETTVHIPAHMAGECLNLSWPAPTVLLHRSQQVLAYSLLPQLVAAGAVAAPGPGPGNQLQAKHMPKGDASKTDMPGDSISCQVPAGARLRFPTGAVSPRVRPKPCLAHLPALSCVH